MRGGIKEAHLLSCGSTEKLEVVKAISCEYTSFRA